MNVRNPEGIWINSSVFSEAANHYKKYGRYCDYKWDSSEGEDFWLSEADKRLNGVKIGGAQITGDHYNYLNYTRIKRVPNDVNTESKRQRKIIDFPSFYDGDYDYFWNLAISEFGCTPEFMKALRLINEPKFLDGGRNMEVLKARRKGYTWKNSSVASNRYDLTPNALILLMAYEKKFLWGRNGIMDMCRFHLDFYNSKTAWTKLREKLDQRDNIRASYVEYDPELKVNVESGFLSQITGVSFHDDPDAARGVDFDLGFVEEAGRFPNWNDAFHAIVPAQEAGKYKTGFLVAFGTGGDMESGTMDLAEHFYEAEVMGYNAYENHWDEHVTKPCGYFHPDYIGKEGFVDDQGNSQVEEAKAHEDVLRKALLKAGKRADHDKHVTEHAQKPSEALLQLGYNPYPATLLKFHLDKVLKDDLYKKTCNPIEIVHEGGKTWFKPVLDGSVEPFNDYPIKEFREGCPMMFEPPDDKVPDYGYVAGYDPVNQDKSEHSKSIAAFSIYKPNIGTGTGRALVLTYWGRPGTDKFNETVIALCEIYRTWVGHENLSPVVYDYFGKRKKLHLLADKPDYFLKKVLSKTNSARTKGCHMNGEIRNAAVQYDIDYMMDIRDHDKEGNPIYNYQTITDIGLLKEYIAYDGIRNTDRVDSVLHIRIQSQNEEEVLAQMNQSKYDAAKQLQEYLDRTD